MIASYSLHLILAKRLKSGEHTPHPDTEGRIVLLNLRIHLEPIRVLAISAMDAGIFLKVGILVVIWYGITRY